MPDIALKNKVAILLLGGSLVYLLLYTLNLTHLPVFADEAIYIRWAQQIAHEPQRLLFYPMLDGKPPLQMWLLIPFMKLTPLDPLWASRFLTICFGVVGLWGLVGVLERLNSRFATTFFGVVLYVLSPFMFFHFRLGLLDPLVTALGLVALYFYLDSAHRLKHALLTGLFLGMALLTKVSALFLIAYFVADGALHITKSRWRQQLLFTGVVVGVALGLFGLLKLSPLFSSLFSRGSDFTFTATELLAGEWRTSLGNISRVGRWLGHYFTVPLLLFVAVGIWAGIFKHNDKRLLGLLLGALLYAAPFVVFGRVLASRYFLPVTIFVLPLASLGLRYLWDKTRWLAIVFLTWFLVLSVRFDLTYLVNPDATPLTQEDVHQYLTAWSSGHGIIEARDFILERTRNTRVLVLTEGYFGTLPDGLLMYFDQSDAIEQLELYGIGEPVREIPEDALLRAEKSPEEVYLVVNEHRLLLNDESCCTVVQRYERPYDGPDLLLLKVGADDV